MSDFIFSEHGEDVLIHRLLLWKERGFYVDCGAYHARDMSLTARLRLFGWTGLNIDIDPRVVESLRLDAPGTTTTAAALGEKDGEEVVVYRYDDPVLNTTSPSQHEHLARIESAGELFTEFRGSERVTTSSLRKLISLHASGASIDFVNIDVEGVELEALKGFPWESQRPSVIAVEIHRLDLIRSGENPIVGYLREVGYVLQSYVFHTAIFCLADFDTELCHRVSAKRI